MSEKNALKSSIKSSFRCAAVFTIGAGTLADIFEPKVRGSKLGAYYAAPLLGPAIGPILGGGKWNGSSPFRNIESM